MKRRIAALLAILLLCLPGCVEKTAEPEPAAPIVSEIPDPAVTLPGNPELPENLIPPGQMPSLPEDEVGIPAPPQPTIVTE
jgi:hypothetical protein